MRALPCVIVVPCVLMLAGVSATRVHAAPNACQMTAAAVLRSCKGGARADHSLALAKCDNQPDKAARRTCAAQAAADAKDTLTSCKDERDVRHLACGKLGPAPYHPTIDPANFVATIDNPSSRSCRVRRSSTRRRRRTGSSTTSSPSPTTRA